MPNNQNLLDLLTREGVLLSVSVRYWRAAKKLQAQNLGLDPDDVTDRLISLGHKRLMPKDALAAFALIESRAHALVDASTFPLLGGIARFLPNRKLGEVTRRLGELEQEFHAEQTKFADKYGRLREEALSVSFPAAIDSTFSQSMIRAVKLQSRFMRPPPTMFGQKSDTSPHERQARPILSLRRLMVAGAKPSKWLFTNAHAFLPLVPRSLSMAAILSRSASWGSTTFDQSLPTRFPMPS